MNTETIRQAFRNHSDYLISEIKERTDRLIQGVEVCEMLVKAGIIKESDVTMWKLRYPHFDIKRDQLIKCREVLGRLKHRSTSVKDGELGEDTMLSVSMQPEKYEHVILTYVQTYTPNPTSKCQIVERTSSYKALVCTI